MSPAGGVSKYVWGMLASWSLAPVPLIPKRTCSVLSPFVFLQNGHTALGSSLDEWKGAPVDVQLEIQPLRSLLHN